MSINFNLYLYIIIVHHDLKPNADPQWLEYFNKGYLTSISVKATSDILCQSLS
jgi:hypothetical protein